MTLWAARLAALRTGGSPDGRRRVERVGGKEGGWVSEGVISGLDDA